MMQVVVSAFMWLLTVVLIVTAPRRRSQKILIASALIACASTLNIDDLYLALDRLVGSRNVVTLIAELLLMTGIYFLSAAIIGAVRESDERQRFSSLIALTVTLVAITVSFVFIEMADSTTLFMVDYGDQLAAAIYSSVQYVYVIGVLGYTGAVVVGHLPAMASSGYKVGFGVVAVGCLAAVLLGLDVIAMNVVHVLGVEPLLAVLQAIYNPLYVAAMLFLCAGLAIVPLAGMARASSRRRRIVRLLSIVEDIWSRHVPEPSLPSVDGTDSEMRLHRMLVEIEDARLSPMPSPPLSNAERAVLSEAERYLRPVAEGALEGGR